MYVMMIDAHIPMFSGSLTALDEDQLNLMYWCKFYHNNVFSHLELERPDEFTIDYDILLDEWLEKKEFREKSKIDNRQSSDDMQHVIEFY